MIAGIALSFVFPERSSIFNFVLAVLIFGGFFILIYYALSGYMEQQEKDREIARL